MLTLYEHPLFFNNISAGSSIIALGQLQARRFEDDVAMINNDWFDSFALRTDWLERLREIHGKFRSAASALLAEDRAGLLKEARELVDRILREYPDEHEKNECEELLKQIESWTR